jgi:cyanophycinase
MVDTRGGAFTVGLGLLSSFSIIPRSNLIAHETIHRTVQLGSPGQVIAAIPEQTALLRTPAGAWRVAGVGEVAIYRDGASVDLDALSDVPIDVVQG